MLNNLPKTVKPLILKPDRIDKNLKSVGLGEGLFFPTSPDAMMVYSKRERWELTRRHPYYINCWRRARDFHHYKLQLTKGTLRGAELKVADACAGVLRGLNVGLVKDFPEPSWEWETARKYLDEGGAAKTMTCRALTLQLLAWLPDDARRSIGEALRQRTAIDALFAVHRLTDRTLDESLPGITMFSTVAPQEAIVAALAQILNSAKPKQTRRRSAELVEQLKVWDLREGWTSSGGYDGARERSLKDIAIETGVGLETVRVRYRRAFELITGRPFQPILWAMLFLAMKLNTSLRKGWRLSRGERRAAGVVEQVKSSRKLKVQKDNRAKQREAGGEDDEQLVPDEVGQRSTSGKDEQSITDLTMDLNELLARGLPPELLAKKLEELLDSSVPLEVDPSLVAKLVKYVEQAADSRLD